MWTRQCFIGYEEDKKMPRSNRHRRIVYDNAHHYLSFFLSLSFALSLSLSFALSLSLSLYIYMYNVVYIYTRRYIYMHV